LKLSSNRGNLFLKLQNYMEHAGQLMSYIKTYDQKTYYVIVDGNRIKISA